MTLSQFITKWNGKKADFDNAYGGQCVDLFRFYVNEVLGLGQPKGVVGAADFWANYATDLILKNNFTQIKNTADFKPLAGDVMIWNKRAGGGFGHIAIVSDDKATLDTFNSFDQNWRALSVCEITKHDYSNVYGVLRPNKKEQMPDQYGDMVWKSTQHDETVRDIFDPTKDPRQTSSDDIMAVVNGYRSQTTDTRNKLATAEQEVANRIEQVGRLNEQLTKQAETYEARLIALKTDAKAIEKLEQEYLGKLSQLQTQVDEMAKDKGKALLRVSVLEAENKDLKDRLTAPLSIGDLLGLIIKKLFERKV
jgi:hypothetical protein